MVRTFIGSFLMAATALAAPSESPVPPTQEPPSIHGYGDTDRTCQQWVDGCRACNRGGDGGPVCSNIGIACQPKAIECTARKEEPAK